jgi:hypothetical protein
MSTGDETQSPVTGGPAAIDPDAPAAVPAPAVDATATTPDREEPSGGGPVQAAASTADERPELLVGGAFLGGLAVAFLLKRAGDND